MLPTGVIVHAPPVVASANPAVVPTHNDVGPVIGSGLVFTVTLTVLGQPSGDKSVIVVPPASTPDTIPEMGSIVATEVLLLLQVPPVIVDANVIVAPVHTKVGPVITGLEFTTIVTLSGMVVAQPVPLVSVPII